jgi:Arc/MetJ-type ribon-helix-helix transcriptional regulator
MTEPEAKDEQKITLRLSEEAHAKLAELSQNGLFGQMLDAYRLAISLALAEGLIDSAEHRRGKTYINAGSLDPDGLIRDAIAERFGDREGPPYEIAERLGEAGVLELADRLERQPELTPMFKTLQS